jgi:hypothetical protein
MSKWSIPRQLDAFPDIYKGIELPNVDSSDILVDVRLSVDQWRVNLLNEIITAYKMKYSPHLEASRSPESFLPSSYSLNKLI